jgi:ammonium transporter Rh
MPGVISGLASAVVALIATRDNYHGTRLFIFYPSRTPALNSPDYLSLNLANSTKFSLGGDGRSALLQAGFQLAGLALTLTLAIIGGLLTGLLIRLPIFEQINENELMFDDEPGWLLPNNEPTNDKKPEIGYEIKNEKKKSHPSKPKIDDDSTHL